jgi:Polyketide cyclase / dehydrase and lipid transport
MASIRKEIHVPTTAADAWDAVRDFGAVDRRVAPGFVTDSKSEGDDRIVTFVSGAVARERLVSVDDDLRRLVYTVVEGPLGSTHHQASVEVVDEEDGCTLLWTTDVLPDDLADAMDALMDRGAEAMAHALSPGTRAHA